MEKEPIPQATSPLATWLSYLEHLHSKTIDPGLARVSEVAARMAVLNRRRSSLRSRAPTVKAPPAARWNPS
jgi:hypothetical protein